MTMICKKCGCTEHYRKDVPPHIGAYCVNCGAWITWVPKARQKQYEDAVAQTVEPPNHGRDVRTMLGADKIDTKSVKADAKQNLLPEQKRPIFRAHELPKLKGDDKPPWEE